MNKLIGDKGKVLRGILIAGASAIAIGSNSLAHAQSVNSPAQTVEEDRSANDPIVTEEIIVTGSRIPRAGFDTVRPAIAIDSEVLDKRAQTNIAEALDDLPIATIVGTTQQQFVIGQSFVDLFGLGSQRTLTLVNGRRFVSSNVPTVHPTSQLESGLQVDFGALPSIMLERVEVVPLAGAAVYGSDAIAGTINVILRDDFEGIEFSAQRGITERGDFGRWQGGVVVGANTSNGRGNVVIGVEYNKSNGGSFRQRPAFGRDAPGLLDVGTQSMIDVDGDGDIDREARVYSSQFFEIFSPYGSVAPALFGFLPFFFLPSAGFGALADGNFYQFNASGDLAQCQPPSVGQVRVFGGTCGAFLGEATSIRPSVDRINIAAAGHYDLTDSIRFSIDTLFSNTEAVEPVNTFDAFSTDIIGGQNAALGFSTSNPFLGTQARGILEGNGLTTFGSNRQLYDLIDDGAHTAESFTWRVAGGFNGNFNLGERKFTWDISGVFGKADVETRSTPIVVGRLVNAIDAVRVDDPYLASLLSQPGSTIGDVNGDGVRNNEDALIALQRSGQSGVTNLNRGSIVCRVNGNIANGTVTGFNQPPQGNNIASSTYAFGGGCIPLNLFGDARQLNSPSAINFVSGGPLINSTDNEQRVFTANFGGELIKLPAGWLRASVGLETRRERGVFSPGLGAAVPISFQQGFVETGGQLRTFEAYGEIFAPLVSADMDIPFVNLLEASASVRRVDDKSRGLDGTGGGSNVSTAYEFGGRWAPIPDVTFRGSYTSAIRSPALVELFRPTSSQLVSGNDPCDRRFVNSGLAPATRRANCIADGIANPDAFNSRLSTIAVLGVSSGNPNLTPERSKSFNIGAVIQPRWLKRFALSVDYFQIEIENRISPLGLTDVLGACYDSSDFPNSPFCNSDLFVRDAMSNEITFARSTSLNAADSKYASVQARLVWVNDVADALGALGIGGKGDLGELGLDFTVLRLVKNQIDLLGGLPDESVGTLGNNKWRGTFNTTYRLGDFRLFWQTIWQNRPVFDDLNNVFITGLGAGDETVNATASDVISDKLSDRFIHNASIQYKLLDRVSLQLSVDNLFDRKVSPLDRAVNNFGADEILGRRYTVSARAQF